MKIEEEIRKILLDWSYEEKEWKGHLNLDKLLDKLLSFFKSYARSLVPEELVEEDIVPSSLRGTLYPPKKPNGYFEGWNKCREEMLRRIEEE